MIKILCCKDKNEFEQISDSKRIICIGGGMVFGEAYEFLQLKNQSIIVLDNDKEKQIKGIKMDGSHISVMPIDSIGYFKDNQDVLFLITLTMKNFIKVREQIESVSSEYTIEAYLFLAFSKGTGIIERSIDRESEILIKKNHYSKKEAIKKAEKNLSPYITENKLVLPKLNFIVTERCSLRCRDCRALIPHVKTPKDEQFETIVNELDTILDAVDAVVDVEPIGGEPFLHPEIARILEYFCDQDKIRNVCVTTNGTIIPNEECLKILKNKKIHIYISDYGYIEKMAKIIAIFEKENISFSVESDQHWFDVGGFEYRNRNNEELKLEYLNCYCEFVLKYVWDNKIWLCPRAPRLSTLGVFESAHDYIDIERADKNSLREAIEKSFYELYAEACNYCNQGDIDIGIIDAGVQVVDKADHSNYTLVERGEYQRLMDLKREYKL